MKNIKKIFIVLFLILIVSLTIILLPKSNKDMKESIQNKLLNNKNIALMLEQDDGKYNESTSNTWPDKEKYIFNPFLSKCDKGGKLSYDETKNVVNVKSTKTEKCYLYFDENNYENYCRFNDNNTLVCEVLRHKGNTLIYHDGKKDFDTEENSNLEVGDLSYRFAGSYESVNNYVCFGNNSDTCPINNLYRIIGLYKNDEDKYETKLIKADYANKDILGSGTTNPGSTVDYNTNGSYSTNVYNKSGTDEEIDAFVHRYRGSLTEVNRYRWQSNSGVANWPTALLNTIHLNHNFLNSFTSTWQEKIATHKWYYMGNTFSKLVTGNAKQIYDNEVGANADATVTNPIKVGLMYISDYLYSASSEKWILNPYASLLAYTSTGKDSNGYPQGIYEPVDANDYRNAINENWMYLGLWEWTLTPRSDGGGNGYTVAFNVRPAGYTDTGMSVLNNALAVRPVFYLKNDVSYLKGNGTINDPFMIV